MCVFDCHRVRGGGSVPEFLVLVAACSVGSSRPTERPVMSVSEGVCPDMRAVEPVLPIERM